VPERSVHTCASERYSDPPRVAFSGAPGSCPALEMGDAGQRTRTSRYACHWGPSYKRGHRSKREQRIFQLSLREKLPPGVL